jgi:protein-arginine kinase activator protein McsA
MLELVRHPDKSKSLSVFREKRHTKENHLTDEHEQKACPSCGNEMEKGYLISKMGVYWDDHVPRFIAPGTLLSPSTTEVFKMHYIPSYRCRSCKIIQYGVPTDFVRLACPHCGAKYEYELLKNSDQITCQNCNKTFSRRMK